MKGKFLTEEVHKIIRENWPIHPSEVCRKMGIEVTVSNISKIKYHFNILHDKKKVRLKKIDRALVAWPYEIERLRIIHDFVRDME
jgi:hypothetical protein